VGVATSNCAEEFQPRYGEALCIRAWDAMTEVVFEAVTIDAACREGSGTVDELAPCTFVLLKEEVERGTKSVTMLEPVLDTECIDTLRVPGISVFVGKVDDRLPVDDTREDLITLLDLLVTPVPDTSGKKTPMGMALSKVETAERDVALELPLVDSEVGIKPLLDATTKVGLLRVLDGEIVRIPAPADGSTNLVYETIEEEDRADVSVAPT
jgi:hypothetical protein